MRAPRGHALRRRPGPAAELGARVGGRDQRQTAYRMPRRRRCGTAGASSPRPRSTSPTRAGRSARRASSQWTRAGLGRGRRAVRRGASRRASAPASREWTARSGSAATASMTRRARARHRRGARRDRCCCAGCRRARSCGARSRSRGRRAPRDAVRDGARRASSWSSTARASATRCSRPAGPTTAKRIEYAAHDVTALLRDGDERARRDPRRRLVRRASSASTSRAPGNHYGTRARAAVRAAPRVRGRHARGRRHRRALARDDRADRVLGPADGRALRRAPRARRRGRPGRRRDARATTCAARARARAADPRDRGAASRSR